MAMSIVAQLEFEEELIRLGISSSKQEIPKLVPSNVEPELVPSEEIKEEDLAEIKLIERGRGPALEIPSPIREFVAQESLLGTKASELSELMEISKSSISAYKHGATSTATYNEPAPQLDNHVRKIKIAIASKARGRLLTAIDSLTDDKISVSKAKDIASIAKDMAAVVKSLESNEESEEKASQVNFVFFAPKVREESSFPIIDVSD